MSIAEAIEKVGKTQGLLETDTGQSLSVDEVANELFAGDNRETEFQLVSRSVLVLPLLTAS